MARKNKRYVTSSNRHDSLADHYRSKLYHGSNKKSDFAKLRYHEDICNLELEKRRILTKAEKKTVWKYSLIREKK